MVLGFASTALVALVMAGLLVALLGEVSGFVGSMQRDETAIRASQALAAAVREQSILLTRAGLDPDNGQRKADYSKFVDQLQAQIDVVAPHAPARE